MPYFNQFNSVRYPDFINPNNYLILRNITSRVVRRENLIDDKNVFYTYTMKEDESIEDVSEKLYGTVNYYWAIMLINNRFDRFFDFPISNRILQQYITEKYGSIATAAVQFKYYIRPDSSLYSTDSTKDKTFFYEVPESKYNITSQYDNGILMKKTISMYDYEIKLNEDKRNILVIQEQALSAFLENFKNLIK